MPKIEKLEISSIGDLHRSLDEETSRGSKTPENAFPGPMDAKESISGLNSQTSKKVKPRFCIQAITSTMLYSILQTLVALNIMLFTRVYAKGKNVDDANASVRLVRSIVNIYSNIY